METATKDTAVVDFLTDTLKAGVGREFYKASEVHDLLLDLYLIVNGDENGTASASDTPV